MRRLRRFFSDLYHEKTNFAFTERMWRWVSISGVIVVLAIAGFVLRGLNLSIDFRGGTAWQVTVTDRDPSVSDARAAVEDAGLDDAEVTLRGDNDIRVEAGDLSAAETKKIAEVLAEYGNTDVESVTVNEVGPSWGKRVSEAAVRALLWFFAIVTLYLSFRFEWKMAISALVAMFHDIIITVGVYALTQLVVTPSTVVAVLTILGFSLYDTIVVFDRVRENARLVGSNNYETYAKMANRSLNQVLARSLNTSLVALMPVASLLVVGTYVFGADTLRDFGVALFVGLLAGTYSSLFVATPLLVWLKEREIRYRSLKERTVTSVTATQEERPKTLPQSDVSPTSDNFLIGPRARRRRGKKRR